MVSDTPASARVDPAGLGRHPDGSPIAVGVLTSGGDAPGMNAAVRAVVRTALHLGAQPYAIMEGWQGAVDGGQAIAPMTWADVGSVLHRGGTVIGTARSDDFRHHWGMRQAAGHLVRHGIDRLVVIGGDGSLAGTDEFRQQWPQLLAELVDQGSISAELAQRHGTLRIAGLVGSIDNDMVGTATTIGADTALHRIVEAIDALSSTAASHQRCFVIEVMGRRCGYLPLMAAIAGGCDYVLVPEQPPPAGWQEQMCLGLQRGRQAGRRDSLVIVAEGAQDHEGNPIKADEVAQIISQRLGEDAKVTILGHVQRGGTPSAFDRWMPTVLGYHAVMDLLLSGPDDQPVIVGVQGNRVTRLPLMQAVAQTRQVAGFLKEGKFLQAIQARGASFSSLLRLHQQLSNAPLCDQDQPQRGLVVTPEVKGEEQQKVPTQNHAPMASASSTSTSSTSTSSTDEPASAHRIAIMHVGGLAPGMNPAVRAAVRLGVDDGHTMVGVYGSFAGLQEGKVHPLSWADVDSWVGLGGAELGTRRDIPTEEQLYGVGRALEKHSIDALIIMGGFHAYMSAHKLVSERQRYPAFRIPIVCVPTTIDNNLPGSDFSVGTDTALNDAVSALDRIKQAASASRRCFVAEIMGRRCGYLTLMAGIATGAERVYLHEDQMGLTDLEADVQQMQEAFRSGRRLYLALRNEGANDRYTTQFLADLFAAESHGLYDVRQAILGHIQQGGVPSPFDRIHATRLAAYALGQVSSQLQAGTFDGLYVGHVQGQLTAMPVNRMLEELDVANTRPVHQWWRDMSVVQQTVAAPEGTFDVPSATTPSHATSSQGPLKGQSLVQ